MKEKRIIVPLLLIAIVVSAWGYWLFGDSTASPESLREASERNTCVRRVLAEGKPTGITRSIKYASGDAWTIRDLRTIAADCKESEADKAEAAAQRAVLAQ